MSLKNAHWAVGVVMPGSVMRGKLGSGGALAWPGDDANGGP
jgi:hypothetical protein